jgi:hypothetical protein
MAKFSFTKSFSRITVNGQTYNSVDEMPPDVRKTYEQLMAKLKEDRDGNGIPDILEGKAAGAAAANSVVNVVKTSKFIVNGQERDISALPAEIQNLLPPAARVDPLDAVAAAQRDDRGAGGNAIVLRLPTLIAIVLTAVVVTIAVMWRMHH